MLVVGAGGLGCPALLYLAGAGVGTIGIIDNDIVDESNLHRQILYSIADVGDLKVLAALRRINQLNPDIVVHTVATTLNPDNVLSLLANATSMADCRRTPGSAPSTPCACRRLSLPTWHACPPSMRLG